MVRYSIDPENRLKRFRHIIEGEFRIDKRNNLSYTVKSPSPPSIPQQLKLNGTWSLNKDHDLVITLDKENNQFSGKKITLAGEIISTASDKIEFLVSGKDSKGHTNLYILALSGAWQADKSNRLKFMVFKKHSTADELAFTGTWEISRKNQIIYSYTRAGSRRGTKHKQKLAFKGTWDINTKGRLKYSLGHDPGSGFEFSVSAGRPLSQGMLYELGIAAGTRKKKVTLFGTWKLNKKTGLLFEMPYENGRIETISFGTEYKLDKNRRIELSLKDHLQKDLGIKFKFSRNLAHGEAFIQAIKEGKKIAFQAGAGWRW